jgi:hypothetical protein
MARILMPPLTLHAIACSEAFDDFRVVVELLAADDDGEVEDVRLPWCRREEGSIGRLGVKAGLRLRDA